MFVHTAKGRYPAHVGSDPAIGDSSEIGRDQETDQRKEAEEAEEKARQEAEEKARKEAEAEAEEKARHAVHRSSVTVDKGSRWSHHAGTVAPATLASAHSLSSVIRDSRVLDTTEFTTFTILRLSPWFGSRQSQ